MGGAADSAAAFDDAPLLLLLLFLLLTAGDTPAVAGPGTPMVKASPESRLIPLSNPDHGQGVAPRGVFPRPKHRRPGKIGDDQSSLNRPGQ